MKKVIYILVCAVIGVALGLAIFGNDTQLYESTTYGFSFEVPTNLSAHTYTEEIVAVGHPTTDGFDALAEVQVISSDEYNSFEEFVFESSRNMCAADGPNETIYCDEKLNDESFENENAINGEKFYFNRVHETFSPQASSTDQFGPFYVFNIQANVPESRYSAILIRPASHLSASEIDPGVVDALANSLTIWKHGE